MIYFLRFMPLRVISPLLSAEPGAFYILAWLIPTEAEKASQNEPKADFSDKKGCTRPSTGKITLDFMFAEIRNLGIIKV